jgi:hypothetical protein
MRARPLTTSLMFIGLMSRVLDTPGQLELLLVAVPSVRKRKASVSETLSIWHAYGTD